MAQGEHPGNIPAADDGGAGHFAVGPQYVISTTLRHGGIELDLPDIHIPHHLIAAHNNMVFMWVQEALAHVINYPLMPGPEYNPLLDLLDHNADYWTIDINSSGDSLAVSFIPVQNTVPQAVEEAAERPAQEPAERPAQEPAERPVQGAAERDGQGPAEGALQGSEERPVQGPAEQSGEVARQGSAERPGEGLAEGPAEGSTERPGEGPAEGPAEGPLQVPEDQPQTSSASDYNSDSDPDYVPDMDSLFDSESVSESDSFSESDLFSDSEIFSAESLDRDTVMQNILQLPVSSPASNVRSKRSTSTSGQSQAETTGCTKRRRKRDDSLEETEPKRRRSERPDSDSGSWNSTVPSKASSDEISFDNEQPGPSGLHNREILAPSHQSSRRPTDVTRGEKRKRTSSESSEREGPKKRRTDDIFNPQSVCGSIFSPAASHQEAPGDDEQPGTSRQKNRKESDEHRNRDESGRQGKRTSKSSGRLERKKRKRSNPDSDSD